MKSGNNPISRQDNIVIQELRDEILIYDLQKNKALCLNQTSAMIWQECDGHQSVAEIARKLSRNLKSKVSEDLVWMALSQFKADNLLDKNNDFVTPLDGLTRREVVRRIGFASIVAIPVISAIVAPTAMLAQSGGQCFAANNTGSDSSPGCSCLGTFDCCGICSATKVCTGPPRGGAGGDPGAAPVCFPNLACSPANNAGSDSAPGCPCIGTFDCCGICGAGGTCTGAPRSAVPGVDPGAAGSCP
jgi:hypothetical protein